MGDDECVEVCVGKRSDMERRCATVAGVCVCVCVCLNGGGGEVFERFNTMGAYSLAHMCYFQNILLQR